MAWSLHTENGKLLAPLRYSNGKTQEDVVREILAAIHGGHKLIFVHGVCGTGKSAIALHVAAALGNASIVVPVKMLQQQYAHDYSEQLHIKKSNGERLAIR